MKRLLLVLMILSACTTKRTELGTIVSEFYSDFPSASHDVSFKTGKANQMPIVHDPGTHKDRPAHGYCDPVDHSITINITWWHEEENLYHKRIVIYHELGHCVLGLMHPDDLYEYTIMNSILTTVKDDGSNWRELVEELKKRSKQ